LPTHFNDLRRQLSELGQHTNLGSVGFTSHRRRLGPVVRSAKRVLHRFLGPVWERQTAFNHATQALLSGISGQLEQLEQLSKDVAAMKRFVAAERVRREELEALRAQVLLLQRENHESLDQLEASLSESLSRLEALARSRPMGVAAGSPQHGHEHPTARTG